MKNILSLVLAGIIGGFIALGGMYFITPEPLTQSPVMQTTAPNYAQFTRGASVPFDFVESAEKVMPTVVHIRAKQTKAKKENTDSSYDMFKDLFGDNFGFGFGNPNKEGTGSGVIISKDGYIVTNNHVIDFADEIEVTLFDNREFKAELVGTDPSTDLAVLKIEAKELATLSLADSDRAKVGEWVLAVGNPFNLTSTVTAGIISAKGRNIQIMSDQSAIEAFIQTDAAVNPGNSGGALVDVDGNLLGINTAIASQTGSFAGYSFAVPVNIVKKVVDDIIKFGSAKRGFLGVNIADLDADLATELGIKITEGVYIVDLAPKGAAIRAGVLPGDVITAVNGKEVKSAPQLQELVGRMHPGDDVNLTINRKGNMKKISVRLKAG